MKMDWIKQVQAGMNTRDFMASLIVPPDLIGLAPTAEGRNILHECREHLLATNTSPMAQAGENSAREGTPITRKAFMQIFREFIITARTVHDPREAFGSKDALEKAMRSCASLRWLYGSEEIRGEIRGKWRRAVSAFR